MLNKQIAEIMLSIFCDKELSTEKKLELSIAILNKQTEGQSVHYHYYNDSQMFPMFPNYHYPIPNHPDDNLFIPPNDLIIGQTDPPTTFDGSSNYEWNFKLTGAVDTTSKEKKE